MTQPSEPMRVAELWVYPVKSCRGVRRTSAQLTELGFANDRRWMVVNSQNVFITARQYPQMLQVEVTLTSDSGLELRYPGMAQACVVHPCSSSQPQLKVKVWEDFCMAWDTGDGPAHWLQSALGLPGVRLLEFVPRSAVPRPIDVPLVEARRDIGTSFETRFTDGFPFLVISERSLEDLSRKLAEQSGLQLEFAEHLGLPLPMRRFRPNIVISGGSPYQEDEWARFRIGAHTFRAVKGCSRCKMTTIDPDTTVADSENSKINPLKLLEEQRDWGRGALFGQNCVCFSPNGAISVGEEVVVVSTRSVEEQYADKRPRPRPKPTLMDKAYATLREPTPASLVGIASFGLLLGLAAGKLRLLRQG
eukprot:RCo043017